MRVHVYYKNHAVGKGYLFPINPWLFFLYILIAITLAVCGILLLINGSWANTGYFFFQAIIINNLPNFEVEDQRYHFIALELLQLTSWICGFFSLNLTPILLLLKHLIAKKTKKKVLKKVYWKFSIRVRSLRPSPHFWRPFESGCGDSRPVCLPVGGRHPS